ncbi:MAG: redoxin domain-containing protein [Capsulimonas sp.]|uniref:peroxiredoxin family protein n=1 Tax=Capsulimonas sp. TaxID=2494211 RepID=UPI0032670969
MSIRNAAQILVLIPWIAALAASPSLGAPIKKKPAAPAAAAPKPAPAFTLADTDGKSRTLAEFQGRPVTLFFFCGCPWCHKTARLWSQFQRGGALPASSPAPATVIVFTGDAEMSKQFASETNLDLTQTTLLPDIRMRVTSDLYHADPCPRAFVLDPAGLIRYTNNHKDDAPREAAETAIVARTLGALRDAAAVKK